MQPYCSHIAATRFFATTGCKWIYNKSIRPYNRTNFCIEFNI